MKKKLQIFLSSTYIDLIDERQAAVQAVLDAGHIPAGMELFKAGNRSQLETIYKWIDNSDVYMLILGGRYGSIEEESGKSYTHLEYEYAIEKGIPVFSVVLQDSFLKNKESVLDHSKIYETNNCQKYNDFKSIVMSKIIRVVEDSKDIAIAIHTTLNDFTEEYDLIGWVRGNDTDSNTSLLKQINDLNLVNSELKKEKALLENQLKDSIISFESDLAFENVKVNISGTYTEYYGHDSSGRRKSRTNNIEKEITWDFMFLLWSPHLIKTQSSSLAQSKLESALKDFMERHFSINDNLFNSIKIQYHALGLIKVYEAKTIAGGVGEFIQLTEKGKNYMIMKKAVKK